MTAIETADERTSGNSSEVSVENTAYCNKSVAP